MQYKNFNFHQVQKGYYKTKECRKRHVNAFIATIPNH